MNGIARAIEGAANDDIPHVSIREDKEGAYLAIKQAMAEMGLEDDEWDAVWIDNAPAHHDLFSVGEYEPAFRVWVFPMSKIDSHSDNEQ